MNNKDLFRMNSFLVIQKDAAELANKHGNAIISLILDVKKLGYSKKSYIEFCNSFWECCPIFEEKNER